MDVAVDSVVRGRLRWGDLVDPRAVYSFTIADAWYGLPTLLAMGGTLIGSLFVCYLIKKAIEWLIFTQPKKWVLQHCEKASDGNYKCKKWVQVPYYWFGSFKHLLIETLFFGFVIIATIFAASVGNVNLVESPITLAIIGTVFAYIFGSGLTQAGSAWFVYLFNSMTVGEWWNVCGIPHQGGRVWRITPMFIEFLRLDEESLGAIFVRVPMTSIMGEKWERNIFYEANSPIVEIDQAELDRMPKRATNVVQTRILPALTGGDYFEDEDKID